MDQDIAYDGFITLDDIVKSILLQRGLTKHWYFKFLKLAADCLRELRFDTMGFVLSKEIEAPANGVITLPSNVIGVMDIRRKDIQGCRGSFDFEKVSCGTYQVHGVATNETAPMVVRYISTSPETIDSSCGIHPFAQKTIEAYVIWKNSVNRDNAYSAEGIQFHNLHKRLRSRLSPLKFEDLKPGKIR